MLYFFCTTAYAQCTITTINADFEFPVVTTSATFVNQNNNAAQLGWKTTATDGMLEFWKNGGMYGRYAYSGTQFVELNANQSSGLYQDYNTTTATHFTYSFAHMGRDGTDTMELMAGPPGGPYTSIQKVSTGRSWKLYSGTYDVPAGQSMTRFIFQARATATGDLSVGNFLDAVSFTAEADPPIIIMTPATCLAAGTSTITNYAQGNVYTFYPAGPTVNTTTGLISGMIIGTQYEVSSRNNNCTTPRSGKFHNADKLQGVPTPILSQAIHPTCDNVLGSFTINNYNGSYTYIITPSIGVVQIGNMVTAPQGNYNIVAKSGICTSNGQSIVINEQPQTPATPTLSSITHPTCSNQVGSFTITNYDPSYIYTITPSTGVLQTGNMVTAPQGSYKIAAYLGSCRSSEQVAVINAQTQTPQTPTLSAITQPTCSNDMGSFIITNYDPTYEYEIYPSLGKTIAGNTVTAYAGSYTSIRAKNGTCLSEAAGAIINQSPITTVKPVLIAVTQPTCDIPTGSFTIADYDSLATYIITPSTGVIRNGATVTAPTGTYSIVTSKIGWCQSEPTDLIINAQPTGPAKPVLSAITQPTCNMPMGSFTITNYDQAYTYEITPSLGVTINENTVTAPQGNYKIVTKSGNCISAEQTAVINAQPQTPAIPTLSSITQPTCDLATGSFSITNYDVLATYIITPSTGVIRNGATVTAPAGTYTLTASLGSCTSTPTNAVINPQPATPTKPILSAVTQPTCENILGSFIITNHDQAYTYQIIPSTGVVQTGNTITAPQGSYIITAKSGNCISAEQTAVINAQPQTPAIPTLSRITQPTCDLATGSFSITNYDALATYTITPSTGVIRNGATVSAPAGTYTLTASLGSCTSAPTNAVINPQPATPTKPLLSAVTQPTCENILGSFIITNYDVVATYTITPSTGVIRNGATVTAPAGTYTLTASLGSCTSAPTNAVINPQPATPTKPLVSPVTQPTCDTSTGSFTITNYDVLATYIVTPSTGVIRNGATVTAPAGNYTLTASLGSCTSTPTNAVINPQPATPAKPILSAVTQPTCENILGSFIITNYDVVATYTITPSTGVIRNGATVTAPARSYTITTSLGSCTSAPTDVLINPQPATPPKPLLSQVTQSTCDIATGSFTITNYDQAYIYEITPLTGVIQIGNMVTAPQGSYTITAKLGSCISAEQLAIINAQPQTPEVPTLSMITQPTCENTLGNFTITNYDRSYTYTITPSTGVVQTGNMVTAPQGSYTITAKLESCISAEQPIVINVQPQTPETPSLSTVTHPTCSNQLGSFTITNYDKSYVYEINPSTGVIQTGNMVTAPQGSYTITAKLESCISTEQSVLINAQPAELRASLITNSILPELCNGDKNASFKIEITGGIMPYNIALDNIDSVYEEITGNENSFVNLIAGLHTVYIKDAQGCNTELEVSIPDAITMNPIANVHYSCTNNDPSNTVAITVDPNILNLAEIEYTLDGNPDNYQTTNVFTNLIPGEHTVTARHINGCEQTTLPFIIEEFEPLTLTLTDGELNEIVANAGGGAKNYQFKLDDEYYGTTNKFIINKSGTYSVTATDQNGCSITVSQYFPFIDICIPNYFTPNGDGMNDEWAPGCTVNYKKLTYSVFDRYGRILAKYGYGQKWDGKYNGAELPAGDYWYTLKLNDPKDNREFVGHFTLYR